MAPGPDAAGVVLPVPLLDHLDHLDHLVQLGERGDLGDGNEVEKTATIYLAGLHIAGIFLGPHADRHEID
ncbi:hypothetical protein P8A22_01155 [Streptomyces laculatispora]|uniref:Uncharacterized protein n=1 Tax=Streptomyces laculatispora TaxID=887464 RepID=A0ABY9HXI8_9ACTN|nr:hypothetical protein [Streptomyces laculatispora]WLQ38774.1 hypothetical protein P8A22_01155 [Streptomyces laculatispora]